MLIISRYLFKYKGQYRIKAEYDKNTNDFPRDETGGLDNSYDDIYIKCYKGSRVYHYGRSILVAYIPSIGRGHNILKDIAKDLNLEYNNYAELYSLLEGNGIVKEISENDEEIEFKFNAKNIEYILNYLKPATAGSSISPFSTKNLPKNNYTINDEDLLKYQSILDSMPEKNYLILSRITERFIYEKLQKSKAYRSIDLKKDMRKKCLKNKEYIHSLGEWDKYIDYLKTEIKKECKK